DRVDLQPTQDGAAAPGLPGEHYSARWTGTIEVKKPGRYTFLINCDDGGRVILDGRKIIEDWTDHAPTMHDATLELKPGRHEVIVEYFQGVGGATLQLGFGPALPEPRPFEHGDEVTALAKRVDAVVVAVGYGQNAATNSAAAAYQPFWPESWARRSGL